MDDIVQTADTLNDGISPVAQDTEIVVGPTVPFGEQSFVTAEHQKHQQFPVN